ncbi:hypothetical protein BE15_30870 [Sorangium cellulosum]|uniref:Uncharacterized protein n=1 Tax=Sorangium cellulosum TaxID=56 RepID=A0A150QM22_SORCE|nr:hypothetical protein BE15_30870 [Sorangium cellulosum]
MVQLEQHAGLLEEAFEAIAALVKSRLKHLRSELSTEKFVLDPEDFPKASFTDSVPDLIAVECESAIFQMGKQWGQRLAHVCVPQMLAFKFSLAIRPTVAHVSTLLQEIRKNILERRMPNEHSPNAAVLLVKIVLGPSDNA